MSSSLSFPNPSPQLFLRHLKDVEELTVLMRTFRETQIQQLNLEPFAVHIYQADFGDILILFGSVDTPLHITGARRSGYLHFGSPLCLEQQPVFVHGQPAFGHTLTSFDDNRGTDTVIPAKSLMVDVQIRREVFERICQAMRRDDLDDRFFCRDLIHLPGSQSVYQHYLLDLLHLIKTRSPLLQTAEYQQIILGDLVPLLIDTIPKQKHSVVSPPSIARKATLARQASDFIQEHLDQPLTLKDIYTALGISRRSLFYSFESTFGCTPIEYLKAQRLQGARRQLKQSNLRNTTITQISRRWGYWDTSKFTKDYKAMFGELPSTTLKRE